MTPLCQITFEVLLISVVSVHLFLNSSMKVEYSGGALTFHQLHSVRVCVSSETRWGLSEFVRYNRAAIGEPLKWQPMNSLVSSCLGSTCYTQNPFARYWRAIKAAANELTRIKLPRLKANPKSYQVGV